jgi:cellulose synthase/poly-beta-1,6-N-acetylglucosamine synthase-like glycosyltransferase
MLYAAGVAGLALYGFNTFWLTWQLGRQRSVRRTEPISANSPGQWPTVTVQLPVFNERHVIARLVDACARLDYPHSRLQIQVLDDSTDQTTAIAHRRAALWRQQGVDVVVVHRAERQGYKAGALAAGLGQAKGEFLAIFDADFVPPPDFLRRIIPHFLDGSGGVGFVQARWDHLNRDYSALTRCQALALDGHFAVEQQARQAAGYPFGFNGSAGVWRRACIEDARVGGWQDDTLCEDLDLSYRAQLAGWQARYVNDLAAPAEVPPQLIGFKRQQFRWAKGSVQSLRKLAGRVWQSGWSLPARLEAFCHLGNYLIHPLLLLLLLVTLPLLLLDASPFWPLAYLSVMSVGPPALYATAQRRLCPRGWWRNWAYLPLLMLLGTGLCLNNSQAIWEALRGRGGQFLRTPKFRVEVASDRWQRSSYVLPLPPLWVGELGLLLYSLSAMAVAIFHGKWWTVPFLGIYVGGFGLMVGIGLWQAWQARPRRKSSLADGRRLVDNR